jgi:hypothetical protein
MHRYRCSSQINFLHSLVEAPHGQTYSFQDPMSVKDAIDAIASSGYLARISGGRATWSVVSGFPIAVVAEQWLKPRNVSWPAGLIVKSRSDFQDHRIEKGNMRPPASFLSVFPFVPSRLQATSQLLRRLPCQMSGTTIGKPGCHQRIPPILLRLLYPRLQFGQVPVRTFEHGATYSFCQSVISGPDLRQIVAALALQIFFHFTPCRLGKSPMNSRCCLGA